MALGCKSDCTEILYTNFLLFPSQFKESISITSTIKDVVDSLITESEICLSNFCKDIRNVLYLKNSCHCYENKTKFFETESNYKLLVENRDKETTQFLYLISHKGWRSSEIVHYPFVNVLVEIK